MQDNYFNLSQEFLAMQREFQSPNFPELNKRMRIYFFLYYIQETYPEAWKTRNLTWRLMSVEDILSRIEENRMPKMYDSIRLLQEIQGYALNLEKGLDMDLGFVALVPVRLPKHPEFWKSYIDDTNATELLNIFKGFVNESEAEAGRFRTYEETLQLKKSLDKYKDTH